MRGRITRPLARGLLRLDRWFAAIRSTQRALLREHERTDHREHGQRDLIELLLGSGALEGPFRPNKPTAVPLKSRVATAVRSYLNGYRWVL